MKQLPQLELFCYVAGLKFTTYPEIAESIQVGDEVALLAEPDNKFDPFAVSVWLRKEGESIKLGYIPRWQNRVLATALIGGDRAEATVEVHDMRRDLKDRLQIHLAVYSKLAADAH